MADIDPKVVPPHVFEQWLEREFGIGRKETLYAAVYSHPLAFIGDDGRISVDEDGIRIERVCRDRDEAAAAAWYIYDDEVQSWNTGVDNDGKNEDYGRRGASLETLDRAKLGLLLAQAVSHEESYVSFGPDCFSSFKLKKPTNRKKH